MSRHLSVPSAAAVEQLLSYQRQLEELEEEVTKVEAALSTTLDAEALGVIKARIAQGNGKVEKLQCVSIDGVMTGGLNSGKEQARSTRKNLTRRAEALAGRFAGAHQRALAYDPTALASGSAAEAPSVARRDSTLLAANELGLDQDFEPKQLQDTVYDSDDDEDDVSHEHDGEHEGDAGGADSGRAIEDVPSERLRAVSLAQGQGDYVHRDGILRKKNKRFGWAKRYFVLEGGSLLYYKSKESMDRRNPRGTITISKDSRLTREDSDDGKNFQIVNPDRVIELHADTHAEMMAWLEALKENLAVLRNRVTAF